MKRLMVILVLLSLLILVKIMLDINQLEEQARLAALIPQAVELADAPEDFPPRVSPRKLYEDMFNIVGRLEPSGL